jgi:hypothetical protein
MTGNKYYNDFSVCCLSIEEKKRVQTNCDVWTVVYAAMCGIGSVDTIVELCKRDLHSSGDKGKQPKRDAIYEFKNL